MELLPPLQNLPWPSPATGASVRWLIFLSICQESSLIFHKQLSKSPLKTCTHISYSVSVISGKPLLHRTSSLGD